MTNLWHSHVNVVQHCASEVQVLHFYSTLHLQCIFVTFSERLYLLNQSTINIYEEVPAEVSFYICLYLLYKVRQDRETPELQFI